MKTDHPHIYKKFGDERYMYKIDVFSGASLSANITLLGEDMKLFKDANFAKETDKMQAIITYVERNLEFDGRNEDFADLRPNRGDWIAYSKDQIFEFKNNFFRLRPGTETFMEIKFAWPIKANNLGLNL